MVNRIIRKNKTKNSERIFFEFNDLQVAIISLGPSDYAEGNWYFIQNDSGVFDFPTLDYRTIKISYE